MVIRLGSDVVTLRRRAVTGQDEYGNDVHTITETPITGCSVQPRTSMGQTNEDNDARALVFSGVVLYAPANPLITEHDVIEHRARRYEVDGEPGVWMSPGGAIQYQQVTLRRVTG